MKTIYKFAAIAFLLTAFTFSNSNAQITLTGSTGGLADGIYTTFTGTGIAPNLASSGVFATLNNSGFTQAGSNIIISITGNTTETGLFGLNAGGWASILITPSGGAARTLSGNTSGNGLILLNGANNVTFNGLNLSGNSLIISNTNSGTTSGTSTIRFINGATNNVITNCTVLGSFTGTVGTNGGNIFFSTDLAGGDGNDNNTISNCDIGPTVTNTPTKLIYGNGSTTTATIRNSGNLIENNNLYDCFRPTSSSSSIHILSGNDLWTINNNLFYQTAPRIFTTTGALFAAIHISTTIGTLGSFTITNNIIGYGSSTQTGTTMLSGLGGFCRPINIPSVSITVATSVQGNTISGIHLNSTSTGGAFIGILCGTTDGLINVGNINGNTIGSISENPGNSTIIVSSSAVASAFPVTGIYNFSFRSTNTSNNRIGNVTIFQDNGIGTSMGFRGITVNTTSGVSAILEENEIAFIKNFHPGDNTTYGIFCQLPAATILNNIIRDISSSGTGLNIVHSIGILCQSGVATVNNIEKNKVYNLTNAGNVDGAIWGIYGSFPATDATSNQIKQNYVYNLDAITTSTNYALVGIENQGTGTSTVYNNMITLGLKSTGAPITSALAIRGIDDFTTANTNNYYYNSIYITGSGVAAGITNTFAMFSSNTQSREFINNIFVNDRSNAVGGGVPHYAISVAGGPNPPGLTSNYNNLYAPGTDGYVGLFNSTNQLTLADWQTATAQDGNSSSVTIDFVYPANGNLDLNVLSNGDENLIATPLPGITTDIHKSPRDATYPTMGAYEAQPPLPVELASFTANINRTDVSLNWTTSSELNNSGFDIERSDFTGQTSNAWTKVGNVQGNGTSSTGSNYSYIDRNLASGNYNYRLKQIDFNGNFEYFNLSNEVNVGVPSNYSLSQNYPNPFNPTTNLEFGISELGFVSLKVFDVSGKEVMTLVNEQKTPGYYKINFNGANLSSGIYFYTIKAGDFTSTKRMILLK